MRAALTAGAAVLLLAAGAGCGERTEPTGASIPVGTVTVTGVGDAPTIVHSQPRRIAAIGPTPIEILDSLGAAKLLVGDHLDILNGQPLVSAIRALHPDLIVGSSETDTVDLDHAHRATGAPVYVAPDGSIEQVEQAIVGLGLLTGKAVRGRELVAAIQREQKDVTARLAGTRPVKVFVDTGYFGTVGRQSLLGDIVHFAKGANVAGENPESGPFSLAVLARRKPQVYLATSDSGTTIRQLRRNPQTKRLPAVRNGRFFVVPAQLVQPGPRIGAGLAAVARLLHPHAFR